MTREEKLATISAAHAMFVQMMEAAVPRDEVQTFRANIERLTGRSTAEPQESAEERARLLAVLEEARRKRGEQ